MILLPKTFGGREGIMGRDFVRWYRTAMRSFYIPGDRARFFKKTQQHNQGFLKILSDAITLLEKSLTTQSGIFENP